MNSSARIAERWLVAHRFTMPRDFYLPPEAKGKEPLVPEGTDLAIWLYDIQTPLKGPKPAAIAFAGKQSKPLFHHRYTTEAQRQRAIDEAIESRKAVFEIKDKRLKERREFKHEFEVGAILYSSWGYDQTNIDFYQVTKIISPKMIEIREIAKDVDHTEETADYVVPVKDRFVGAPQRRQVAPGHTVRLTSFSHASAWDGKPKYQTGSGFGH
jgi:hypothetical protein